MAPPHLSQISNSVFRNELNFSSINPPSNRMQRSMDVIEVENQNLYGSESNVDCIYTGGNVQWLAFHQVRDQILLDPELFFGGNADRDNINGNYRNQVSDQILSDHNPIRSDMNIVGGGEILYQPP